MKINCPSCGAKYTIADDRVRGRKVKVRCKSCSTPIVVDGTEVPATEAAGASVSAESAPQAGAPHAGGDDTWSVNLSDSDQRDMTLSELVAGWQSGEIPDDAFVWKDGMGDWAPILEAPELRPHLAPRTAATPEPAPPLAAGLASRATRRADVRPQETADLFGNVASAGSEEEQIATSAPLAGESSYVDNRPTGARNENSVLFSLDSLKAGVAPQRPVAATPAPVRDANDPFGMGAAASGAQFGGASLFGAGANQALLLTPPPPEPEPPKAFAAGPGPGGGGKAKVIAAIATIAALLMGAALVVALTGRSDDQEIAQAKAESAKDGDRDEQGSKSDAEKASREKEKEAQADEKEKDGEQAKSDDEDKSTDKDDSAGKQAGSKAPSSTNDSKGSDSQGSTSSASTGSGSDTPPSTASKGPKVTVKENPSSGVANFNTAAARTALANAAAAAPSCRKVGGPTGPGKALVTFAPSGRVTTATVTGAFAGTSVGGCIASLFRKARVPAFNGAAVTVSKSFAIQ
jgi:predicted Zn finger-like uncharacterized protein